MPKTEERRLTLRLSERDLANLDTIQSHLGVRAETEAVRAALHTYAILIRDELRAPTVASER